MTETHAAMPRSVLLINPNTSEATTQTMLRLARMALPSEWGLERATAAKGASIITTADDLAIAVEQVVAMGLARAPHVCAIVIAAFGDPGLAALQARIDIPVIGIGEASMREAAQGGRRFGIATITQDLEASISAAVTRLGLSGGFTGCRIPPTEPVALAQDPIGLDAYLAGAVHACMQDGARAVVIGGGPLAESAGRIASSFEIPVISPIDAAMRAALTRLHALASAR